MERGQGGNNWSRVGRVVTTGADDLTVAATDAGSDAGVLTAVVGVVAIAVESVRKGLWWRWWQWRWAWAR